MTWMYETTIPLLQPSLITNANGYYPGKSLGFSLGYNGSDAAQMMGAMFGWIE